MKEEFTIELLNKLSIFFKWTVSFYLLLILNQHFLIPLRYIPWALISLAIFSCCLEFYKCKWPLLDLKQYYADKSVRSLLRYFLMLSTFFLIATVFGKLSDASSLFALLTIYIGPIALGAIGIFVFQKNIKTVEFLCIASALAILFLALTDTLHYARDWYRLGRFPDDYSHRWFGDGYIFFIPWLLLGFIKSQTLCKRAAWLAAIFWVFLLLSGTGSRAIMGIALLELTMFMSFYRRKLIAFVLPLVLIIAFELGSIVLAPTLITSAVQKGAYVQNRVYDAWLPVFDFISHSPWMGYGFSRVAWDRAYDIFLRIHTGWSGVNAGGPHNFLLDITFIGGVFATLSFILICFYIIKILLGIALKSPFELAGPALATLCSFIDFYLVRGLVESCRWEPLGITLMWVLLLAYLDKQRKNAAIPG